MAEEDRSKIEELSDALYSRTRYRDPQDKRSPVTDYDTSEVGGEWQTPALDEMLKHERIVSTAHPFMKKVFIFALLFFLGTIIIGGFIFFGGINFVSSKNVDINVLGPATVSAGEALELGINISNNNNADLELANLSIQYPSGSRNPDNTLDSLTYTKDDLGVIGAGRDAVHNIRVVLLGATGEKKEIKFSVEYKVKGSNATFYKDKIFEVVIGEAPITLSVESPASVTSGESFTTVVSVALKSSDVLKDVVLKAEYPHGYSVLDATSASAVDDNIWALGDLSPGSKKTISIRGKLVGENREERTFRFYVGVADAGRVSSNLKIVIASLLDTVVIERPSIGLNIAFNGDPSTTYIAPAARPISTSIRFQNNLSDKLLNPRLEVRLSGAALDKFSITTGGDDGFYDSGNSRVTWSLANTFGVAELNPGEGGQVALSFASLPSTSLSSTNNEIALEFILTGVPVGSPGQRPVTVSEIRKVRISSQVSLSSRMVRSLGPFANTGPIPPKVDETTTYTALFNLGNTQADMTNAIVTAKLGPGVTWVGASSVSSEDIAYNSSTNTVTWNLGTLSSGSGFSSGAREVAFQVSLTPSISQIGTVPVLVNSIVFSGTDTLSGNVTTINNPPLTTRVATDPAFIQGDDIVQQ